MEDDLEDLNSKRDRSPAFPYLGLMASIELARKLYQVARGSDVRLAQIAPHWNTTPTSGSLPRYAGALQGYGLIESSGSKETRKIRITDEGRRILEDTRPGVAESLKSQAAMKPKMFSALFELWGRSRPSDDIAMSALQFDHNFTPVAAKRFLSVFDEAVSYVMDGWTAGVETAQPKDEPKAPADLPAAAKAALPVEIDSSLRRDVFALDEGEAVLTVPRRLSRESFDDLTAWLELVRRKLERSVV